VVLPLNEKVYGLIWSFDGLVLAFLRPGRDFLSCARSAKNAGLAGESTQELFLGLDYPEP